MKNTRIEQALRAATETADFITGAGCRAALPQILRTHFPGKTAVIVADEITFAVAGRELQTRLEEAQLCAHAPFIFPGKPVLHGEYSHIARLRDALAAYPPDVIPVAVGAGTINDIVKRAAFETQRRYVVVATAASVDGYSSFGAAIVKDGFKQTLECAAPLVIVADIEILRDAPPEMTAAGYADLMSKIPAGADWILADVVGADPIDLPVWDMVQADLRAWLAHPEKLRAGDLPTFEMLFEGLTMTGLAMQVIRKSRPASGAEHLLSHIWEMQGHRDAQGEPVSHGFQVSIGTLASTALMETVLARDIRTLDIDAVCQRWQPWEARAAEIQRAFDGTPFIAQVLRESQAKYLTREQLRTRLEIIVSGWDELRQRVARQLFPYQELKRTLQIAACPVTPAAIQLDRQRLRETYRLAQMIRNRYTILDFAFELNWFESCVEEILASNVYLL